MRWDILNQTKVETSEDVVKALLKNRGIKEEEEKEFFSPHHPSEITLKSLGIKENDIEKAYKRIKEALRSQETVIIYGDYDADGITGTATLWETLNTLGLKVLPHIPERFTEGYGLNLDSVKNLKQKYKDLGLIITVDHGITATKKIAPVKKLGIDMIITDHHQADKIKPKPLALIHTTDIGGSAVSWIFAREMIKRFKNTKFNINSRLELAAIGTIADQLSLTGANRSIVKYGLQILNKTKRSGLLELFRESGLVGVVSKPIGTYEVGFVIAPRINSMGRLKHGLESLRLLCTTDLIKAKRIAGEIGITNSDRQKVVDEVISHARSNFEKIQNKSVIVLSHKTYHEGVIGLAAAKLVEEFYRPAIVLSENGDISKASARSIQGFNIIESIRKLKDLYIEGGGHPMAAGFSIKTVNILEFDKKINEIALPLMTPEILEKKIKIDLQINFKNINKDLIKKLNEFEPLGIGNFAPTFMSEKIEIMNVKPVGTGAKHLKLKLKQNDQIFDAIFFSGGKTYPNLKSGNIADIVFHVDENFWNGITSVQLRIRDMKLLV